MASTQQPAPEREAPSKRPTATWVLMALILVFTLSIINWGDRGLLIPPWLLVVPSILGLVGAWLAARKDCPGWMIASGVWGLGSIPALIFIVTLVAGP